ncbi:hypothetical protein [Paraburkholderia tropica]|uniref:hypothetical protein n=1 Tax=Paraburkholderia tropica TaxID=92647 RepID=UPI001F3C48B0|nr:hypothetical protein [Paraburkholderia tropica]
MDRLASLQEAHQKVLADAKQSLDTVRHLASLPCDSTVASVDVLRRLRSEVYEDLNQIQHEHLIIRAAEWLFSDGGVSDEVAWFWNPRQTGDASEPDLRGILAGKVTVSAEVTASERPVGTIDSRMQKTLTKLSNMEGKKYYFVRTEEMRKRASTKIAKGGWPISVVHLDLI